MPPGFTIHAANRLELLAEALAGQMRRSPGHPLDAERIVVPHPVLGRWLRLRLASELGIAAHLQLELPAEFAWSVMGAALPNLPSDNAYAPASLRWRIYELLGQASSAAGAEERPVPNDTGLARYLADGEPRKRFELADRLAGIYDRCLLYRPDWIRSWQRDKDARPASPAAAADWLAELWAQLADAEDTPPHWVDVVDAYREAIAATAPPAQLQLPLQGDAADCARASFFAVPSLSPSYLDMLRTAARTMAIHLYLPSPCREFWADTRSRRERRLVGLDQGDGYYDEGNVLLSAWGRTARDMQASLADDLGSGAPEENYAEPAANTRLAALQRDILTLRGIDEGAADDQPPADDSLQIHVCHSAMREAEVVHDRLLDLFETHPDIQPADVLILAPGLDVYAPAIEAVFSAHEVVPFNLGRQRRGDSAAVRAFIDLLDLPGSRYATPAVMAPLRARAVRARFGIDEDQLASLREWISAAGIRWGIDAASLATQGPCGASGATHTWREGMKRLVLGYATADQAADFEGVVPCALRSRGFDAGTADYECLGRFARYCEEVLELDSWQQRERTPSGWAKALREGVFARFFVDRPGDVLGEGDAVAALIDRFVDESESAGELPIPFSVVRDVLTAYAEEATRSVVRLADGVAIGQLAAGQVFPAKVVCALGMNDRLFPRHPATSSFDPMAAGARRIGDRDLRDEDRYAFLEALLAARRSFIVTYTGRDLREDAALPASTVVGDLLEYLHVRFADGRTAHETRHPLQPFSPRYFQPSAALFSYSQAMADAANALASVQEAPPDRFASKLPAVPGRRPSDEVAIHELCRFAAAPVRYFVERRLGLRLGSPADPLEDEEALELSEQEEWRLKNELFHLDGGDGAVEADLARRILLARGCLPGGNAGLLAQQRAGREVEALVQALHPFAEHRQAPACEIDVQLDGCRLVGSVARFLPDKHELLNWRIGGIRAVDRIETWLCLLAATCASGQRISATMIGIAGDVQMANVHGPAPDSARAALADWLGAWRDGQTRALPLFAETSWAWVAEDESQARKAWFGGQWGEGEDAHHQLVFPDGPFSRHAEAFGELAERLLTPIAAATAE